MSVELKFHEGVGARKVYMYVYVKAVSAIDCINQSFVVQFHQYLQWAPTKAEYTGFISDPVSYRPAFVPTYAPSNARVIEHVEEEVKVGQKNAIHLLMHDSPDLWGEKVENLEKDQVLFGFSHKYRASISCPMNMHNFPFDVQSLHIFFECLNSTNEVLLYPTLIKESCCEMELGTMASSPEFKFHQPTIEFAAFGEAPKAYSCCTLTVKCSRRCGGFLWRVVYPLASLSLINLGVFFYEVTDFSSRLSFLITLLLAIIAFQIVVMQSIPPIPYISQADVYVILCLAFTSCIILYVCIINKVVYVNDNVAIQIMQIYDASFGIAFLFIYVIFNICYLLQARRKYSESLKLLTMSYSELMNQELLAEPYALLSLPGDKVRVLYEDDKKI